MAEKEYIEREKINRYISKLQENINDIISKNYNKYIFGGDNDLTDVEKDAIINFSDDISYDIDLLLEETTQQFRNIPASDVAPVKHGHWINENFYTRCSVCGNMAIYDKYGQEVESDYCPRCGAKMDGKREVILCEE